MRAFQETREHRHLYPSMHCQTSSSSSTSSSTTTTTPTPITSNTPITMTTTASAATTELISQQSVSISPPPSSTTYCIGSSAYPDDTTANANAAANNGWNIALGLISAAGAAASATINDHSLSVYWRYCSIIADESPTPKKMEYPSKQDV
jgi:hypothetical protein